MYLESIHLKNFRNYEAQAFLFGPGVNILTGKNAQGKTNVIEAISILTTGLSFRAIDHKDTIKKGCAAAEIRARALSSLGADEIIATVDEMGKRFLRNGKKTTAGGIKTLSSVLFAPEEIVLLRDSPSARRRYMDTMISKVDETHKTRIREYEKIVRHRNRLLEEGATDIDLWDERLSSVGVAIIIGRNRWCARVNGLLPEEYRKISPGDRAAEFRYKPNCVRDCLHDGEEKLVAAFLREIRLKADDERARRITLVGPHRDDFEARVEDVPLKNFGSQGEHRTFVLSLKMAEALILREETKEEPILLLDDVASELDEDRNRFLFDHVNNAKGQVFITATNEDNVRISAHRHTRKFSIFAGQVINSRAPVPLAEDPQGASLFARAAGEEGG